MWLENLVLLTVLLERQSDEEDLDFALVIFDRVIPLVCGEDGGIGGLFDYSISVRVLAARCLDALVPEPFVSTKSYVSSCFFFFFFFFAVNRVLND